MSPRRHESRREGWEGWDEYAPFYDWENARTLGRRDVPFWRRIALASARSGARARMRHRTDLAAARAGGRQPGRHRSLGADARSRASPSAPAPPGRRRADPPARCDLVRGDIRVLPFAPGAFGTVIAPYGILQSLLADRDLAATLDSVARVLEPGGTFGLDLVPDVPELARVLEPRAAAGAGRARRPSHADRVGPAGSRPPAHDVRAALRRAAGRAGRPSTGSS